MGREAGAIPGAIKPGALHGASPGAVYSTGGSRLVAFGGHYSKMEKVGSSRGRVVGPGAVALLAALCPPAAHQRAWSRGQ